MQVWTSADALLPLEMVYAFEPVPPEAPPPLDATLDDAATASGAPRHQTVCYLGL